MAAWQSFTQGQASVETKSCIELITQFVACDVGSVFILVHKPLCSPFSPDGSSPILARHTPGTSHWLRAPVCLPRPLIPPLNLPLPISGHFVGKMFMLYLCYLLARYLREGATSGWPVSLLAPPCIYLFLACPRSVYLRSSVIPILAGVYAQ